MNNTNKKEAEELALKIEEMQANHKQTSERLITVIESFLNKYEIRTLERDLATLRATSKADLQTLITQNECIARQNKELAALRADNERMIKATSNFLLSWDSLDPVENAKNTQIGQNAERLRSDLVAGEKGKI